MFINKRHLHRRTFLRGVGATLALPLLDAMVPALTAQSRTAARPIRRLAFIYLPNGVARNFTGVNYWTPLGEGASFEFSPILKPLEPFRERMVVVSGLAQHQADAHDDGANGDHSRGTSSWLTGVHPKRTEGADIRNGVSADQIAAMEIGKDTALPSLELAIDLNFLGGQCENSYACAYMNTLSWSTATTPLPTENNPRIVFERLFGDGGTAEARRAELRKNASILDWVMDDMARLQGRLGPTDRTKVDEYLESVREVERRVQRAGEQTASSSAPALDRPASIPAEWEEHVKLMFDLQVLALRTDMTRIITFQMAREGSTRTYPHIGVPEPHHPISHHSNDAEKLVKLAKINAYHVSLFAYLLERLKATPDGDGTLLDHSTYVLGSGMGNPDIHDHRNLPIVVARGQLGAAKDGYHVKYPDGTPLANLHLTLLDGMGVHLDNFVDSTGRLGVVSEPLTI
jgi:hypothetical protein